MAKLPDPFLAPEQIRPSGAVATYNVDEGAGTRAEAAAQQSASGSFGELSQIALRAHDEYTTAQAQDAANKLAEARLTLEDELKKTKGQEASTKEFFQSKTEAFTRAEEDTAKGLNGLALTKFKRISAPTGLQFKSTLLEHQAREATVYKLSTQEGTIALGDRRAAVDLADVGVIDPVSGKGDTRFAGYFFETAGAVAEIGRLQGWAPEKIKAETANAFDRRVAIRVQALLSKGDAEGAEKVLKYYSQERNDVGMRLSDDVSQKLEAHVRPAVITSFALGTARNVLTDLRTAEERKISEPPPPVTIAKGEFDFNAMLGRLIQAETRGRHWDKDGNLITSSAGAEGVTQVMPATQIDPGFGVKPLQNKSKAEFLRVGEEYLRAMLKEFGGDPRLAAAAYNAGPGTMQRVVAQAKARGVDWLTLMSPGVQKYVEDVVPGAAAMADAQVLLPTVAKKPDLQSLLEPGLAKTREQVALRFPNDPIALARAEAAFREHLGQQIAAQSGKESLARDAVLKALAPPDAKHGVTTGEALRQAIGEENWANIPSGMLLEVRNAIKQNADIRSGKAEGGLSPGGSAMFDQIVAGKVTSIPDLYKRASAGEVPFHDLTKLEHAVNALASGGPAARQAFNDQERIAHALFQRSTGGITLFAGNAEKAFVEWRGDVVSEIDKLIKDGKRDKIMSLFDRNAPEYVLAPDRVNGLLQKHGVSLGAAAAAVAPAAGAPKAEPVKMDFSKPQAARQEELRRLLATKPPGTRIEVEPGQFVFVPNRPDRTSDLGKPKPTKPPAQSGAPTYTQAGNG